MRRTLVLTVVGLSLVCLVSAQDVLGRDESNQPPDIKEQAEGDGKITIIKSDRRPISVVLKTSAEGRLSFRCDRLRIHASSTEGAKCLQLEGIGNVTIRGSKFQAQAKRVTYEEQNNRLIFIGAEKALASLTRLRKGQAAEIIRARKIIYYRGTGRMDTSN